MFNGVWQHRLTRNTGALIIVQLVNYVVPFLLLVYLTRTLGVETYGVLAFSIGITQLALVVLDFGFTLSATERISVLRERKQFVAKLVGAIFVVKGSVFLLVACTIGVFAATTSKYEDHAALFVLSLLPMLGHCFQPIWLFSAIERMRYITILVVVVKIVSVSLVFVLVSNAGDYLWVPVADGAAQVLGALLAIFLMYQVGYHISWPRLRHVRYALKMNSGFLVSRLSVQAYLNSGVFVLGLIAAPAIVAIYALAEQIYRAMQSMFHPLIQALYPYMAKAKDLRLLAKIALGCVILASSGATVGYFATPYLIPVLFGAGWEAAVPVINVFLLAITLHVVTVLSGYPLAAALGALDVANRSVVFGSLVYIVCALALYVTDRAVPVAFAWLMIVAESYVLLHRAIVLLPRVRRFYVSKF